MHTRVLLVLMALMISSGCGNAMSAPEDHFLGNPVFPSSRKWIDAALPAFDSVVVQDPTFVWRATEDKLVFLGVFRNRIQVRGTEIVNVDDNVWAWHSGVGKGRPGSVRFADGFDVSNGKPVVDRDPTPLEPGRSYYWAVWSWDEKGESIAGSSSEMFFTVSQ